MFDAFKRLSGIIGYSYTVGATCDGGSVVEGSVGGSADSSVLPVVVCLRMCPNDPCTYTAYGQSQLFGIGHTSDSLQVQVSGSTVVLPI